MRRFPRASKTLAAREDALSGSYRIETTAVGVEVTLDGGRPLVGQMFLRPSPAHTGMETIIDRLNDTAPVFPLRVTVGPDQGVHLVNKARVRYLVAPSSGSDERVAGDRAAATQIGVTAVFDGDLSVSGVLFIGLPPQKARALDYVNDPGREFVTLAQPGQDVYVNRRLVRFFRDAA
jgi:hypothetical protein